MLAWFKKHGRNDYPWRHSADPYHVLLAETFLQRTKAEQVLPVYNKFIETFPAVSDLAGADEEKILAITRPLGLIWRGKNLRRTALDILEKFGGRIPSERESLLEIRGVGDYIADSILYLVFGNRTSIVDSNVVRIIGRLHGIETDAESRRDKEFRKLADELLPARKFREFNLALLDLGALVCIRNPRCGDCPITCHCSYSVKNSE